MNKKLITLAVAAAITAPAAAFAEATIYGVLHESIDYVDVDEYALWGAVPIPASGRANLGNAAEAYGFGVIPGQPSGREPANVEGPDGSDPSVVGVIPVSNDNTYADNAMDAGFTSFEVDGDTFWTNGETTVTNAQGIEIFGGANIAGRDAYNEALNAGLNEDVATVRQVQAEYDFANLNTTEAQRQDAAAWARAVGAGATTDNDGEYKGWGLGMNPRSNRIGIKGSEDLGGGLKAIYQVEIGVDLSNDNRDNNIANGNRGTTRTNSAFSMRNSFVGLAGNWGTFLVGRHDTPYKISMGKLDMFADTMADFNWTVGFNDLRADSVVAYISPTFSGFQLAAASIPSGGATPLGSFNADANGFADAWSIAAIYSNGPFYGALGYEALGDEHWKTAQIGGIQLQDWYKGLYDRDSDDDTKWSIGLGLLDWNGFSLTGRYEGRENVLGAPRSADTKLWQIQAGYAFGNNTIKGMYGSMDLEKCADTWGRGFNITCDRGLGIAEQKDKDTWAIAFDHNFSKRTRAYALYTQVQDDAKDSDWSGFSLGMIHKF